MLLPGYKLLTGFGPNYINNLLIEYKASRNLRSTDLGVRLGSLRIQTKCGEVAFSSQTVHNRNMLNRSDPVQKHYSAHELVLKV